MHKQQHHLSDIGFQRMLPPPILQPYIQWFWSIQPNHFILAKRQEFMHATGSLSLLFNWGDELTMSNGNHLQSIALEEVNQYSRQIVLSGNIQTFGILFRPSSAFRLFGIPAKHITDVSNLQGLKLSQLHEQLADIPTFQEKVERMEAWLIKLLETKHTSSKVIPASLNLIEQHYGKLSIQQLADNVYLSERQLERLFQKEVGLSPKKYSNLIRIRQARLALKRINHTSLADIAYFSGFYDQAHFNREFKKTIGITPKDYLSRQKGRAP